MATALIGHTGFVGGNFKTQARFDDLYNSSNVESIAGKSYDLVVSAGAPAAKWIANQKPAEDRASIEKLMKALSGVRAERFVLVSTVDVYPRPVNVDERTPIDRADCQPYGRHRLELESFVAERFHDALIVRLPGLFGPGLKKNVVYDFLHENRLDLVHQDGVFQFYDLANVWTDVQKGLTAGLRVVNFATEPVSVKAVAEKAFGREFQNSLPLPGPRYDFHTLHAGVFGGHGHYISTSAQVLARMKLFVAAERSGKP
jgi:nucleoside-diphosphate-sugar epimerase